MGNSCSTIPTLSSSNCFPSGKRYKATSFSEEIIGLVLNKTRVFNFNELLKACDNFKFINKINGANGFGRTYKGVLDNGALAALKVLDQGTTNEFRDDINSLVNTEHKNLVKLLGLSSDGNYTTILVFEYLKNGDLYDTMFRKKPRVILSWPMRHRICIGVAEGLCYLHDDANIVHKFINPSNILLDDDFTPKICVYGRPRLSKLDYDDMNDPINTGYMAPEYYHTGCLTKEQDVYAFGIVILQIFSGKPHFVISSSAKRSIAEIAWELHKKGKLMEMVDESMETRSVDVEQAIYSALKIGLLCTHLNPALRPSISTVLETLRGNSNDTYISTVFLLVLAWSNVLILNDPS